MKSRRIVSILLAVIIVVSCTYAVGLFSATGAQTASVYQDMLSESSSVKGYGLAETVNDGTILQAWNWSFKNIEDNLELLAEQGFTTVQVSPPNEIKAETAGAHILEEDNQNGWWMFYQPAGFQLNNSEGNALGTKAEFESMCTKAHEYGIKIIVDAVINHMGTKEGDDFNTSGDPMSHVTPLAQTFEPEIYDNQLFHSPWKKMEYLENPAEHSQYDSTYDLTRNCTSGLPDLKTEDSRVQKAIYDYMDELIEAGADGFRFDAAKHIETPDDISGLKSDFWVNTLSKVRKKYSGLCEVYAYGEILNNCGVNRPFSMYTKYFDVTDSGAYWGISDAVKYGGGSGNATPSYPNMNFEASNTILWDESHDTYMDGSTTDLSVIQRGKIWALCAGRAEISTVYFARPDDSRDTSVCYSILLGEANQTSWSNKTTQAINRFHNYFIGETEYCTSNDSGWAMIERGNTGAVIVHLGGSNSGSVNITNHVLQNGTYKDSITGRSFYVSNGRITGSVGRTGVACIYYDNSETPSEAPTEAPSPVIYPEKDGYNTIIYTNNAGFEGTIYLYYWKTNQDGPKPWPGGAMQYFAANEFNQAQYYGYVPKAYDNVIITNGTQQTVDTKISGHTGVFTTGELDGQNHYKTGTWAIEINNPTEPPVNPTEAPTDPVISGYKIGDADSDNEISILDATAIQRALAQVFVENYNAKAADADEDGEVSILDATAIQRYLAELDTEAKNIGLLVVPS